MNKLAKAAFSLSLAASVPAAQSLTFEELVSTGDLLPDGKTVVGFGLAPSFDGTYAAVLADTANSQEAVIRIDVASGDIEIIADHTTVSPTYGVTLQSFWNPAVDSGQVVYPAAGLFPTQEMEGIYTGPSAPPDKSRLPPCSRPPSPLPTAPPPRRIGHLLL